MMVGTRAQKYTVNGRLDASRIMTQISDRLTAAHREHMTDDGRRLTVSRFIYRSTVAQTEEAKDALVALNDARAM